MYKFLESGKISRQGLTHLILFTDGIYPLKYSDSENENTFIFIREVIENGLSSYLEKLNKFEDEDVQRKKYLA
ncbi:hypothetical protein [Bacillus cytotoxicus]|uniref:hypothetical protein n=1 Tax=Bacillus cytotoxicus TaxID=580165 RepID=UPI003D7EF0E6